MTLAPGKAEGGPDNRQRETDQWLFVASGEGNAIIDGKRIELRCGTLVMIEPDEANAIRNTRQEPSRTLTI